MEEVRPLIAQAVHASVGRKGQPGCGEKKFWTAPARVCTATNLRQRAISARRQKDIMQAWMWWALGLLCFGIETLSLGSFVFVFFGVGALAVGAATLAGLTDDLAVQSVVFIAVAAVSMVLLRQRLRRHLDKVPAGGAEASEGGEMAMAAETIAPGAVGQIELRGTVWKGRNNGSTPLQMGQSYRVVRIDNLTVMLMDRGPKGELR